MTKLSRKNLSSADMGNYVNNLWSAFTLAGTKEDIRNLFKDLFTHTEYKMFAKRLEVSRQLIHGERYEDIVEKLKVTPPTIAKLSNILAEGGGGLRKAVENLDRLEDAYWRRQRGITKSLENPFKKRFRAGMIVPEVLAAGVTLVNEKVSKKIKIKSAGRNLKI